MNPLLMPVVAVQGRWLRSALKVAPTPAGPESGAVPGAGPALRIAVVGDSSAAAFGVTRTEDGFAVALAEEVAARCGRTVEWVSIGRFGATARRVRHRLLPGLGDGHDVVAVLAGANDVLAKRTPEQWRDDLGGILADLTDRAGRVTVPAIPPFGLFPALPRTLRRHLAERASTLDAVARELCARDPARTTWIGYAGDPPAGFFGIDGFHPSAVGYRFLAREVAGRLDLAQE